MTREIQKLIAKFTADITAAVERGTRLRTAEVLRRVSAEAHWAAGLSPWFGLELNRKGTVIDHINGNAFDYTPANLRFATPSENRR